jgi:microcompartment protein CcmL/EutN
MAQDLTVNIKTTSDVPQAMDKAKAAATGFDKQVADIGKKFSTSFKDIFLGFAAPMVLLQGAISMIQAAIAKAKQDAKEGLDLIAKGETVFASSEEKRMAILFKAKKQREDELNLIRAGKEEMTRKFLTETESGKSIVAKEMSGAVASQRPIPSVDQLSKRGDIQGEAVRRFLESPEGAQYAKILAEQEAKDAGKEKKDGTFKGPEGFGSVIGVGANPVIEAMTKQTEILEGIKKAIENQAPGGGVPPPFTEKPVTMRNIFNA